MANSFKSNFLTLFLYINLFLIDFCYNKCKKIRLIQPLDPSTGLSYVVFGGGNYYMITNKELTDPNIPLQPFNITDNTSKGFRDPTGILVYFNKDCSPPKNFLFVHKYINDQQNNLYTWYTTLNLKNWSASEKWSKPDSYLPDFLAKDPYMGNVAIQLDFTMLWAKTNRLYMIQFPIPGAAQSRWGDYHTIKISDQCLADGYLADLKAKKIVEILEPYKSFDCCFIHDNQQIICYGSQGFTAYDIDLSQTDDNNLRVKSINTQFQRIPIMDIIEKIAKHNDCIAETVSTTTVSTTTDSTTTVSTTELSTESSTVPVISSASTLLSSSDDKPQIKIATEAKEPDENRLTDLIWLILILLLLSVIIFIFILCLCCKKRDKQNESPIGSPISPETQSPISPEYRVYYQSPSSVSQKSDSFSYRSPRPDVSQSKKGELSAVSLNIQPSKYTQFGKRDAKNINGNLDSRPSQQSSISSLSNVRSRNEQKVSPSSKVNNQNLDSERSKYSIDKKTVPNVNAIGSLPSNLSDTIRSKNEDNGNSKPKPTPPGKDTDSNIDSQRSKDNSRDQNLSNASAIGSLASIRSKTEDKDKSKPMPTPPKKNNPDNIDSKSSKDNMGDKKLTNASAIGSTISNRSKNDDIIKIDSTKVSTNTSNLEPKPSIRSKNPD